MFDELVSGQVKFKNHFSDGERIKTLTALDDRVSNFQLDQG